MSESGGKRDRQILRRRVQGGIGDGEACLKCGKCKVLGEVGRDGLDCLADQPDSAFTFARSEPSQRRRIPNPSSFTVASINDSSSMPSSFIMFAIMIKDSSIPSIFTSRGQNSRLSATALLHGSMPPIQVTNGQDWSLFT